MPNPYPSGGTFKCDQCLYCCPVSDRHLIKSVQLCRNCFKLLGLPDPVDKDRRERIATAAMQGLIAADTITTDMNLLTPESLATKATKRADALIKELDK